MIRSIGSTRLMFLALILGAMFCLWQTPHAQAKLTKVSPKAHASRLYPTSNVFMEFYKQYPDGNMVNYTKAFDDASNSYQFNWNSGALKVDPSGGIWLNIAKRETFLYGYISYSSGNYSNSLYQRYQWDGIGYVPFAQLVKGADGKNYMMTLQSVSVQVFDPRRGTPPLRGGQR